MGEILSGPGSLDSAKRISEQLLETEHRQNVFPEPCDEPLASNGRVLIGKNTAMAEIERHVLY